MTATTTPPPFRGVLADAFASALDGGGEEAVAALLAAPDAALPVATAADRGRWDAASGRLDAPSLDGLLARARADLGRPWPQPLASAAARVHRDGDRDTWEQLAFARQHRLSRAVVAAATTLDPRWIDEAADGVQLMCEQSSWCWPAHDDTRARHGAVLATVTDPFLDLGAGEVVGQLAWADHLLGAALDERYPGLRERIRHEARVRVIDPFVDRRDWHWIGLDGHVHNWNPWIHGNVLVAALRLLDDPADRALRARVVALAIEGIDRYVTTLPADGAVDEGYSYWWQGACRALEALDLLAHATAGRLDASAVPPLRETVAFPHRMHLGGPWYLDIADGQARPTPDVPWHALHRAAVRAGDADAAAHAAAHRDIPVTETAGLGRLLRGLADDAWLAASVASPPLPRDVWFLSTQVLVAREARGSSRGLTVTVKGGHNGENHNHNDVGSFTVASDGVPVLVDAGRPTYTAATFGPDRYDIWTMQSSWHNVPEIAGSPQSAGARFAARDVARRTGDAGASLSLELADAYAVSGLQSWRRTVALDRATGRVVIDDAWSLDAPSAAETTVRMLAAGTVELHEGWARIQPLEGAAPVVVRWPRGIRARLVERALDDPLLSEVWGPRLTRIDLVTTEVDAVSVTVERDITTGEDDQ